MSATTRPRAQDFLSTRDYVRAFDVWAATGLRGYSRRAFARWARISSPNFLTLVVQGKRALSEAWLEGFLAAAKLERDEADHLRRLARLERTRDPRAQSEQLDEIRRRLARAGAPSLAADRLEILRRPLAWTLYHMLDLVDAEARPGWFKKRLRLGVAKADEIQSLLGVLERLGLVRSDDEGWHSLEKKLESTDQLRRAENAAFHAHVLAEAAEAVQSLDPEERAFGSLTATVPRDKIEELKQEVNRFGRHLMERYATSNKTDGEVVRVNIQLYPLTRRDSGEPTP